MRKVLIVLGNMLPLKQMSVKVAAGIFFRLQALKRLSPLVAILVAQSLLSLTLQNTAYQDEALYIVAGSQLTSQFHGGPPVLEPYAQYFSGLPWFYPVLSSTMYSLGGLAATRLLSLCFMLNVTVAVYLVGRQLFSHRVGVLAAAVYAGQGSVLFLGHFAAYDALCLALLAWSTVLAVQAPARPGLPAPSE